MLQGWDAEWVTSLIKTVRYVNLPPGKYTLRLTVCNAAGTWSDEKTLQIFIHPPFWQRTWFLSLLVLALMLVIVSATYSLTQQKAKRKLQVLEKQIAVNAERNRISADMHDEIGSGITQIALLSELIQSQHKETPELKKDIHVIATSARKLVQTMSEIIWALNPQNDTLENLLAYLREQSQQYFELLDVQFDIDFPEVIPDVKLTNAERRNLYLVAREALNNAMKHSGASIIQLKMELLEEAFCFTVTDDGSGIPAAKIRPGSNGMGNMKKRMMDINGSFKWNGEGKGTLVTFCLPIHD
jgi:signal transduction histidine kinase